MFINPNDSFDFDLPVGQRVALYSGPGNGTATIERIYYSYSSQKTELLTSVTNETKVIGPFNDNLRIRATAGINLAELSFGSPSAISLSLPPPAVFGDLEPQSIIEPAATFVTLTYQNNTGLVQIDSAGAHGLTAAVAVGNDVFVTWAGGTGVNGFYEITGIDADTTGTAIIIDLPFVAGLGTPTVAVANTAVTLASFTIPGWSMAYGGEMNINALWTLTNSVTAKNIGITYGGGTLLAVSGASNASACAERLVYNRGNNEVITNPTGQLGHGLSTSANVFLAVNTMEDQTFAITAQPAAANNVVKLEAYKVIVTF